MDVKIYYKSGIAIGNRPKDHTCDIMGTNEEPWMTRKSINRLYEFIKNSPKKLTLLEYGSGSSTAYFLSLGLKVTSIEHHNGWLANIKSKLNKTLLDNWTPCLINSQKEGDELGSDGDYYDEYVNHVKKLGMFDIIIVDGRCRSSCIKYSITHLNAGGLFICDNAERSMYQEAINKYIPTTWEKHVFPTAVNTTIIWMKPI